MNGNTSTLLNALVALIVFIFAGFVLYITRSVSGDLNVGAVALVGPPIGAVVAYFFHAQASGQGAAISAAGATSALAASTGQPTAINTAHGTVTTGGA